MIKRAVANQHLVIFILSVLLTGRVAAAQTVTLNFDTPTLSPGIEIDATSYLSSFSITLTSVTSGSEVLIIGQGFPGLPIATSGPNYFNQANGNRPETMTLNFQHPLSSISFFGRE
jgi:hypothetical protein